MTKSKKPIKKATKRAIKKTLRKQVKTAKNKEGKLIGKITHYFSNIEVAVITLVSPIKKGDVLRIIGGQETDFEQKVASMQVDHKDVKVGRKGDSVGMKVNEKVHDGYKVYKI